MNSVLEGTERLGVDPEVNDICPVMRGRYRHSVLCSHSFSLFSHLEAV